MRYLFPAMSSAAVAALVLAGQDRGPRVIENRGQALPKGARRAIQEKRTTRKDYSRKAAADLVRVSNQTLVVAHLHPRWLRQRIEAAMDAGQNVTMADVERMRADG